MQTVSRPARPSYDLLLLMWYILSSRWYVYMYATMGGHERLRPFYLHGLSPSIGSNLVDFWHNAACLQVCLKTSVRKVARLHMLDDFMQFETYARIHIPPNHLVGTLEYGINLLLIIFHRGREYPQTQKITYKKMIMIYYSGNLSISNKTKEVG